MALGSFATVKIILHEVRPMETERIYIWGVYKAIGHLVTDKVGQSPTELGARLVAIECRKTGYLGNLKKIRRRIK